MVLQPGSWVTQNVRLESRIASGGMGEVWRGEHVTLRTKVAVKCLSPLLAKRAGALRRFLGEAQIAARMNDPHTVRVLDCVVRHDPDGQQSAFIVMELLEGEDLARHVERVGPLSLDETTTIVQQVACALGTAHDLGIVHRDVKPENIFLAWRAGRPAIKLLDFGVAKDPDRIQCLTMVGVTLGTPEYMSPEQLRGGQDVDARCDVWSLAVVAYTCLLGHRPFEGRTVGAIHAAIHEGGLQRPSSQRPYLSPEIDALFARAFHPQLESRFQRAADLADALAAAQHSARPAPEPGRPVPSVSTSRVCVIGDAFESTPSIPFELVPLPQVSAAGRPAAGGIARPRHTSR